MAHLGGVEVTDAAPLSVILPAHDEADWIERCLAAVCNSCPMMAEAEIIVVANGCADETAARARVMEARCKAAGFALRVLELSEGSKIGALNAGDATARHDARVYLDADVEVSAGLLPALARVLATPHPRYASGTPILSAARSAVTRAYGRYWMTLPFNTEGVGGYGIFALNGPGRARWKAWPEIISDDTFARLHFAPEERIKLPDTYRWPLVEGFGNLVRVRRRQNRGVREISTAFSHLLRHDSVNTPGAAGIMRRALREPVGFLAYAAVALTVTGSAGRDGTAWTRGR